MGELSWSADYTVHITAIDNEHKVLISVINDMEKAMATQGGVQVQLVSEILATLSTSIRRHFESEERLLLFNNYPDIDAHHQEHQQLLEKLDRFEKHFSSERCELNDNMMLFLKDWLTRHIILHDIKFGNFFRGKELIDHFG